MVVPRHNVQSGMPELAHVVREVVQLRDGSEPGDPSVGQVEGLVGIARAVGWVGTGAMQGATYDEQLPVQHCHVNRWAKSHVVVCRQPAVSLLHCCCIATISTMPGIAFIEFCCCRTSCLQ